MRDFVFQGGKARIIEERREPLIEARGADARGAVVAGPVERSEGGVVFSERGMDRGDMRLVDITLLGELFQLRQDAPGTIALASVHVTNRQLKIRPS